MGTESIQANSSNTATEAIVPTDHGAMTFFDWVERDGQAAVGRALGDGFHAVRVHRAVHAKHAVDEGLIARCEAVLGDRFDRAGTLDRWYQLRQQRLATVPTDRTDAA